jgi:hypothetical protein
MDSELNCLANLIKKIQREESSLSVLIVHPEIFEQVQRALLLHSLSSKEPYWQWVFRSGEGLNFLGVNLLPNRVFSDPYIVLWEGGGRYGIDSLAKGTFALSGRDFDFGVIDEFHAPDAPVFKDIPPPPHRPEKTFMEELRDL